MFVTLLIASHDFNREQRIDAHNTRVEMKEVANDWRATVGTTAAGATGGIIGGIVGGPIGAVVGAGVGAGAGRAYAKTTETPAGRKIPNR